MLRRWKAILFIVALFVIFILFCTRGIGTWLSAGQFTGRNAPTAEWNSRDTVVLYNRIPKTGSTSFMGIVYDLCRSNHFNVIHVNISRNNHYMSLWDQLHFAQNISNWVQRKPAVYHGHVVYINFKRLGAKNPIYINVVRDPLERLISYYYFLRYGDDFRPYLSRRRKGNNETFDQCIRRGGKDCNVSNLWLQIPFFCGHSADCRIPGNPWALSKAKETLLNDYLLVGITEELEDFVLVLEVALPSIFAGAMETIKSGAKFSLRKTLNKVAPSGETLSLMRENNIWKMEQEFYEFAKRQFHFVKAQFLNGIPSSIGTQRKRYPVAYHYEKMGEKTLPVPVSPVVSVSKGQLAAYERKRFEAMEKLTGLAIDKDVVTELCQYIDCSALYSVAEERYLNNTCGYVLCSNSLSPKRILPTYSLRGNRVHLNKERVWFCSRLCQGKYHYLAVQLPEEPFWACLKSEHKTLVFLDSSEEGAAHLPRQEVKKELDYLTSALSAIDIGGSSSDASANEELAELDNVVQNSEQLSEEDVENASPTSIDEECRRCQDNVNTRRSTFSSSAPISQVESRSTEERLERIRALYFEKAGSRLKAKTKPPTLIDPIPLPISISSSTCAKSGKPTQGEYEENCRMIQQWFKGITLNWRSHKQHRQAILSSKEVMKHVRLTCQADSQDQRELRRSIFYAGISKSLPFLFQSIGLELTGAYKDDLKLVISSLQLDAGNVSLKPAQWILTAHFLLSIISLQRPELMQSLESEKGKEFCKELLSCTNCSPDAYRKFIADIQALCN